MRGIDKSEVRFIIDTFLSTIKQSVEDGDSVQIRGFGTFFKSHKKPRKVFSPIAGRTIDVPAKTNLGFKASKATEKEAL